MSNARPFQTEQAAIQHLEKLEADLASVRRELDHSHRLTTIGTVTAGLAHELNNILTPPLAYTQLAQSRPEDIELQKKAIEKSRRGLEAASRILRAVLEFSASGDSAESRSGDGYGGGVGGEPGGPAGREAPGEVPVADVRTVLDAALDCLGRDPAKDGISLTVDVERGVAVAMEPLALQQVILNLLLNARRAIGRRGGSIRITSKREPRPDLVKITIADDGPGIPESVRETLFEPFVTKPIAGDVDGEADGDAQPDGRGGTGLGLAVCRRSVEDSGGTIVTHPTPGGGATFVILVPVGLRLATRRSA